LSRGFQFSFVVYGQPATQGSKIEHLIRRKGGEVVMRNGRPLTALREDNPRLPQWRQEVAQAARRAYSGPLIIGPVRLSLVFYRPRPGGHFGEGKNAGKLKPSAPEHPIKRPDLLKLARAVEDALTGVIWRDDSQVVEYAPWDKDTPGLAKRWGPFQVKIRVESVDGRREQQ